MFCQEFVCGKRRDSVERKKDKKMWGRCWRSPERPGAQAWMPRREDTSCEEGSGD